MIEADFAAAISTGSPIIFFTIYVSITFEFGYFATIVGTQIWDLRGFHHDISSDKAVQATGHRRCDFEHMMKFEPLTEHRQVGFQASA